MSFELILLLLSTEAAVCRCSSNQVFLKILQYSQEVCIFIKKRPQHRCFPMNNTKFLRAALFIECLWWLLLLIVSPISKLTSLITFGELRNNIVTGNISHKITWRTLHGKRQVLLKSANIWQNLSQKHSTLHAISVGIPLRNSFENVNKSA